MTRNNADFRRGKFNPQGVNDVKTSGNNYVMYSGTSKENAKKIVKDGPHEGIYLTTDPSFAQEYGSHVVTFHVPKNIRTSAAGKYDPNKHDAEMDTWGNHAFILHNPSAVTAIKHGTATKAVSEHYYGE